MSIIFVVPLKMDAIYEEVMDSEACPSLEQECVRAHLRLLCGAPLVSGEYEDENEDVLYSVGTLPFFSINFVL